MDRSQEIVSESIVLSPLDHREEISSREAQVAPSQLCVRCAGKLDNYEVPSGYGLGIDQSRSPSFEFHPPFDIPYSPLIPPASDLSFGTNWQFDNLFKTPGSPYDVPQLFPDDPCPGMGLLKWTGPITTPIIFESSAERPPSPSQTLPFAGATIPQRPYRLNARHPTSRIGSITFATEHGDGYLIRDALNAAYTGLIQRDDAVFLGEAISIYIRIEWPGYPSWGRQIKTRDWRKTRRQITLAKLGTEVAKCLNFFIQQMDGKFDESTENPWQVGTNRIGVDDIALISLEPATKASWQPVFRLVTEPFSILQGSGRFHY
jgi:hypothetical protein